MTTRGCSCPSCPKCPNALEGSGWFQCRPCAVGWHRPGHCDIPEPDRYFPIEMSCTICGFDLNKNGRH